MRSGRLVKETRLREWITTCPKPPGLIRPSPDDRAEVSWHTRDGRFDQNQGARTRQRWLVPVMFLPVGSSVPHANNRVNHRPRTDLGLTWEGGPEVIPGLPLQFGTDPGLSNTLRVALVFRPATGRS